MNGAVLSRLHFFLAHVSMLLYILFKTSDHLSSS